MEFTPDVLAFIRALPRLTIRSDWSGDISSFRRTDQEATQLLPTPLSSHRGYNCRFSRPYRLQVGLNTPSAWHRAATIGGWLVAREAAHTKRSQIIRAQT